MTPIFLLAGPPAVGKSSTGRALAARFPKSIFIPVDDVRTMVQSGVVHPGDDWSPALIEQLALARTCVSQMAAAYHRAGFAVVIDDFWDPHSQLSEYRELLRGHDTIGVLLYPTEDTALARSRHRAGPGAADDYIAGGIRAVYAHLQTAVDDLAQHGWLVLDTTTLSVAQTVEAILRWHDR